MPLFFCFISLHYTDQIPRPSWWGESDVVNNPPEVEYEDVMDPHNDGGMASWMSKTVSTS